MGERAGLPYPLPSGYSRREKPNLYGESERAHVCLQRARFTLVFANIPPQEHLHVAGRIYSLCTESTFGNVGDESIPAIWQIALSALEILSIQHSMLSAKMPEDLFHS